MAPEPEPFWVMTRRALRLVVATACVLASIQPGAHASDATAGGCGTKEGSYYTGSAACHLYFRGLPITVRADARATSGTASVRVEMTDYETGLVVVLSCEDSGGAFASCGTGLPDETTFIDIESIHFLRCRVTSHGTGQYWCQTGQGF